MESIRSGQDLPLKLRNVQCGPGDMEVVEVCHWNNIPSLIVAVAAGDSSETVLRGPIPLESSEEA